jgi:hypothetical protein
MQIAGTVNNDRDIMREKWKNERKESNEAMCMQEPLLPTKS